jgi:predicted SnoaL-like aldol condensation-catalyzing enzyme
VTWRSSTRSIGQEEPDRRSSANGGEPEASSAASVAASSVSGLVAALSALAEQGITMRYDGITHVVAEGDVAYVRSEGTFANEPFVFHDLFRVAGGRCAEHWDVMVRRA